MITISYFFGGIAKINADWLHGEPMRMWLANSTDFPVVGEMFVEPWVPYFFSYAGMLFDLLIVPLLIWRRTRPFAVALVIAFHLTNARLFDIGIFPWFMLLSTPMFFHPSRLQSVHRLERVFAAPVETDLDLVATNREKRLVPIFIAIFAVYHLFMLLRHHLYPGNVNWTEEGHNWSWHMKLRSKRGSLKLTATDPETGESWTVRQRDYLTSRQRRKMRGRPDMIVLFTHYLETKYRLDGYEDVEIRAEARISLNGRPRQLLIDPTVDLTKVSRSLRHYSWIVPLE